MGLLLYQQYGGWNGGIWQDKGLNLKYFYEIFKYTQKLENSIIKPVYLLPSFNSYQHMAFVLFRPYSLPHYFKTNS